MVCEEASLAAKNPSFEMNALLGGVCSQEWTPKLKSKSG